MKGKGSLILGALVLLSSITSIAHADVVELKTGQRVEGTLMQTTPASVVIEVGGQKITFDREKVRAIYFGSPPAQPTAGTQSLADSALQALKALRSSTQGAGLSYREYGPRLTDAKIVVDRYLEQPEHGDAALRRNVDLTMKFYVLAARAWEVKITGMKSDDLFGIVMRARDELGGKPRSAIDDRIANLARDPVIQTCPQLMPGIEGARTPVTQSLERQAARMGLKPEVMQQAFAANDDRLLGLMIAAGGVQLLWSCASDKIGEAEKLLGK